MRKVVLNTEAEGVAEFGDRVRNRQTRNTKEAIRLLVQCDITITAADGSEIPDSVRDNALNSIQTVMRRETERFAQIAAVDLRDQQVEREEIARIRQAPAERPVVIVGAGMKDATKGRVDLFRNKDGSLIDNPTEAKKRTAEFERRQVTAGK